MRDRQSGFTVPLIGWKAEFDLPVVFLHHTHMDIIPLRSNVMSDPFLKEIERGETVYER
jgi:hypothetical protein